MSSVANAFPCCVLLLAAVTACGSATPAATPRAPVAAETAAKSEGQRCIEQASAPHDKKPNEPTSIDVSHVLVRSAESKNAGGATRTREEACLRALEAHKFLEGGASFEEAVKKYSDAPGATEGALGSVKRGELDPKFADAAFALGPNELSWVVETPAGFHVIARTK